MNLQTESPPRSQLESQYALQGVGHAAVEKKAPPTSADRLYQLAALTAGIILLATLL